MQNLRSPLLLSAFLLLWVQGLTPTRCSCIPHLGCNVALGNYVFSTGDSLDSVATKFQTSMASIQQYNQLSVINSITPNQALSIPFQCACMDDDLGHTFHYTIVDGDSVYNVISMKFGNLSQTERVLSASGITDDTSLQPGSFLNIPVNCSCGDPDVSMKYGMFLTYVIQAGDTLTLLSQKFGIQADLLSKYNGNVDMNNLVTYTDVIFVPAKDANGVYPPYNARCVGGGGNRTSSSRHSRTTLLEILVKLVGWCKANALCLVYEFVENETLKHHLKLPETGGTPLTWLSRLQIALDSATGVEYIHMFADPCYVHRDINPNNILLDNNLRAKVADFGLAKFGEFTRTENHDGTAGYMAPEYLKSGDILRKMDVFAFGVVLLQLVSAKLPFFYDDNNKRRKLIDVFAEFIKSSAAKEKLSNFVDPTLKESVVRDEYTSDSIWKVILLACECTDLNPDSRPEMGQIATRLASLSSLTQDTTFGFFNWQGRNGV